MEGKHATSLACRIALALLNYDALSGAHNTDPIAADPDVRKKLFRPGSRSKCTMKTPDLLAQNTGSLRPSAHPPADRVDSEDHS